MLLCALCSNVFLFLRVELLQPYSAFHFIGFVLLEDVWDAIVGAEVDCFSLFFDMKACLRSTGSGGSVP